MDERVGRYIRRMDFGQREESEPLFWTRLVRFGVLLRAEGYQWEWAGCYEVGPEGGHGHGHLVTWGDYVPHSVLLRIWRRVTCDPVARVTVKAVASAAGAVRYVTKQVGGYVTKGGRRVHYSRNFEPWAVRVTASLAAARPTGSGKGRPGRAAEGPHALAAVARLDAWWQAREGG